MTTTKDINKAAKKINSLAKSIRRYCYQLENPSKSNKLWEMTDQFDDMKDALVAQGVWSQVCDITGMSEGSTGADCAA